VNLLLVVVYNVNPPQEVVMFMDHVQGELTVGFFFTRGYSYIIHYSADEPRIGSCVPVHGTFTYWFIIIWNQFTESYVPNNKEMTQGRPNIT
jgi:hypothetical protein